MNLLISIILISSTLCNKIINHKLDPILLKCARDGDIYGIKELFSGHIVPDVNARDRKNVTSLILASRRGHINTVRILIFAGANINDQSGTGWTPLMFSVSNNHKKTVRLLIDIGVDVNIKDIRGHTALTYAALDHKERIIEMLLIAGADINSRDNDDYPVRDFSNNKAAYDRIVTRYKTNLARTIEQQPQLIPVLSNIITDYL